MSKTLEYISNHIGTFSIGSIATLIYSHYKDRVKVKTKSVYYREYEDENMSRPETIKVKIVNVGKRPIILTGLTFIHNDGSKHGSALGYPNGKTLNQDEHYFEDVEMDCTSHLYCFETDTYVVNIYFGDTHDRKFYVNGAKENLKRFWEGKAEKSKLRRQKLLTLVS